MNIRVQNGKRTITLTKTERSQMAAAQATCAELSRQAGGNAQQAAAATAQGLAAVLAEFRHDATQSEPEAVSVGNSATGANAVAK